MLYQLNRIIRNRKRTIRQFVRSIRVCGFYHSLGYGWREAWQMADRTLG